MIGAGLAGLLLLVAGLAAAQERAADEPAAEELMRALGFGGMEGAALDKAIAQAASHPLGFSKNPVRADSPPGERAYLRRLRCADGTPPSFERQGSSGIGPFGRIMDIYRARCAGGEPAAIYMDMYHKGAVEARPVAGFTIEAPDAS